MLPLKYGDAVAQEQRLNGEIGQTTRDLRTD
jgi:hypothetical protein